MGIIKILQKSGGGEIVELPDYNYICNLLTAQVGRVFSACRDALSKTVCANAADLRGLLSFHVMLSSLQKNIYPNTYTYI